MIEQDYYKIQNKKIPETNEDLLMSVIFFLVDIILLMV